MLAKILSIALFIVFNNFSVTETDSLTSLALETCATIPTDVDAIFQLWILTHTSAYCLLQNSNYLNCIRRFVCSNECSTTLNQVHLGPSTYMHSYIHTTHPLRTQHARTLQSNLYNPTLHGRAKLCWITEVVRLSIIRH